MNNGKTKSSFTTHSPQFALSDKNEVVSTHDLILMSDNFESKTRRNGRESELFEEVQVSNLQSYEEEWSQFFKNGEVNLDELDEKCRNGALKTSYFRSIHWRILLGILHKQPMQWLCQLQTYRKHYSDVLTELDHNPWNVNIPSDNPLSQESGSVWQKYFCDKELKAVILQDVKRTFPDISYFRSEEIQKMMVRILFCYARQNPILCYRQGMHEILAPLILVLSLDHRAFLAAIKQNPELEKNVSDVLCPDYLEHDAYSLFKNVMSHIQYSYRINNMKDEQKTDENEIISRLDYIKRHVLIQKDAELCSHLEKLDIPLHLFGIRWLRLLFGREFQLQDLLALWDFIFASNFECINHIVVAMLVAIRQILLQGDYNTCLSVLMKYPNGVNVSWIVAYAKHLKDPATFPMPDSTPLISYPNLVVRRSVEPETCRRLIRGSGSSRSRKWFSPNESLFGLEHSGQGDLMSRGFVFNNANFPKDELEQIKMVLSLVHHKLLHFHTLLRARLQDNTNPDIECVINGIYEISCFLKKYDTCEIETACEAGEIKDQNQLPMTPKEKRSGSVQNASEPHGSTEKSHTLPKIKKPYRSGELKVFKRETGGSIVGAPMKDPLHLVRAEDPLAESP